jgi:hypothetical protein
MLSIVCAIYSCFLPRSSVSLPPLSPHTVSHIYELALAGYSFKVLPANYVLHIAHASAKWRAEADKSMVNVDKLG